MEKDLCLLIYRKEACSKKRDPHFLSPVRLFHPQTFERQYVAETKTFLKFLKYFIFRVVRYLSVAN